MNQLSIPRASAVIGKINITGNIYFDPLGVDRLDVFSDRLEFGEHTLLYENVEQASVHLDRSMFLNSFRLDLLVSDSQFVFNFRAKKEHMDAFPEDWKRSKNNRWFMNIMLIYISVGILFSLFSLLRLVLVQ